MRGVGGDGGQLVIYVHFILSAFSSCFSLSLVPFLLSVFCCVRRRNVT